MPAGSKRKAPPLRDAHTASPRPPRDPADDCETPAVAYAHLAPLLTKLAQRLKKPVADLRVWDPYHCAGGVISRLGALGFTHVVNDPELDFYDVVDGAAPPPPHDVLVTNPPFSGNHARALFQYLRSKDGKKGDATPFAVLAPEYVHRKAWYAPRGGVFYMVPESRYEFVAAGGGRSENTDVPCRHWRRERRCPRGETCPFVHEGPGFDPGAEHTAEEARRAGYEYPGLKGKPVMTERWCRRLRATGTVTSARSIGASSRRGGRSTGNERAVEFGWWRARWVCRRLRTSRPSAPKDRAY